MKNEDPAQAGESYDEKIQVFRKTRNKIKELISDFLITQQI